VPLLSGLVQCWFALQTLGMLATFLPVVFTGVVALWRQAGDQSFPLVTYTVGIVFGALALLMVAVPAIACWTMKMEKPSARRWGIAASLANLLIAAIGVTSWLLRGRPQSWLIVSLCGVAGVLGLIVSCRWGGSPTTKTLVA
jgi:hypothetical protein